MSIVNNQHRAHEGDNVHTASILKFAAGIVVLIGVCIIASLAVLRFTAAGTEPTDEPAEVADAPAGAPPVPKTRLQIAPEAELQAFARDKAAVLNSYGWIDRSAGRVRIPIAQAIALAAQRGLPVFAATQPANLPIPPPVSSAVDSSTPSPGKEPQ